MRQKHQKRGRRYVAKPGRRQWSYAEKRLNTYARTLGVELVDCGEWLGDTENSRELLREALADMKRYGSLIGLASRNGYCFVMVRRLRFPAANRDKMIVAPGAHKPSPPGRT